MRVRHLLTVVAVVAAGSSPARADVQVPSGFVGGSSFFAHLSGLCETVRGLSIDKDVNAPSTLDVNMVASNKGPMVLAQQLARVRQLCAMVSSATLGASEWEDVMALHGDPGKMRLLGALAGEIGTVISEATVKAAVNKGGMTFTQQDQMGVGAASLVGGTLSPVVEGIVKFLVKRAQQEGILFFKEQIAEKVCKAGPEHGPKIRRFFPNLCRAFEEASLDLPIQALTSYLARAARADLAALPERLADAAPDRKLALGLMVGMSVYRAAAEGRSPLEILVGLGHADLETVCKRDGRCEAIATNLLRGARVIGAITSQAGWQNVASRPQLLPYLTIAVLIELQSDTSFKWPARTLKEFAKWQNVLGVSVRALADLRAHIETIRTAMAAMAKNAATAGDSGDAKTNPYAGEIARSVTGAVGVLVQATVNVSDLAASNDNVKGLVRTAAARVTAVSRIGEQLLQEDYAGAVLGALELARALNITVPPAVTRGATIFVELANAKSGDEVARVIEAAAAPPGSYRVKFRQPALAVNAFVGAGYGWVPPAPGFNDGIGATSIYAPVGIHATLPVCHYVAIGLFLSVLDPGVLLDFGKPVEETMVSQTATQQIGLAQILSPGAYVTLEPIKDWPLTLGFGVSRVPNVWRIASTTDGMTAEKDSLRVAIFIALELTILPF